jgi:hypothetical protein
MKTTFIPLLIALQFAAFGWRINREIPMGDKGLKTWLPIADLANILSMLSVVIICIIIPMIISVSEQITTIIIAEAFVLIVFHPINMAAHYRLFSKLGRYKYEIEKKDFPYITDQEIITYIITFIIMTGLLILSIRKQ